MGDEAGAAAGLAVGGDGDEADGGAVVFEGHFGVGHEAGAGADVGGDGELAFGGDAHGGTNKFLNCNQRLAKEGQQNGDF